MSPHREPPPIPCVKQGWGAVFFLCVLGIFISTASTHAVIDSSQTESQIVVLPYLPTSEPIVYVYKVKKEGEVYYAISFGLIEQASRISMQNARLYTSFEESKKALLFYDKDHFKRYLEKGNYKIMPILRMTHVPFRFIEYQQIEELSQKEKADLRSLLNWRDEPLKK